jgi:integrase
MRRNELLVLRWDDIDVERRTVALNRGSVAVGYELRETRGKTRNAPRPLDLDATTIDLLRAWRVWQTAERIAVGLDDHGWVITDSNGVPVHPHAISQAFERIARRAGLPLIRLHGVRHTHATLLIRAGVPAKVVSERLGHATAAFTIETYQHVVPGMQADAASTAENLLAARPACLRPAPTSTGSTRLKRR